MRVIEELKKKIDTSLYLLKYGGLSSVTRPRLRIAMLPPKIHNINLSNQLAQLVTILCPNPVGHTFRSSTYSLFKTMRTRTRVNHRAFATAAAIIYNDLLLEINPPIFIQAQSDEAYL